MRFANSDTIEAAKKAVSRLRNEHSDITVIEDTAQQAGKHAGIEKFIEKIGFNIMHNTLPIGDYALLTQRGREILNIKIQAAERNRSYANYVGRKVRTNSDVGRSILQKIDLIGTYDVAVDTKQNLDEVVRTIGGLADERIDQQAIRARNSNTRLYIVVAHDNMDNMQDIESYCRDNNYNYTAFVKKITFLEQQYGLTFCICPAGYVSLLTVALLTSEHNIISTMADDNDSITTELQTTDDMMIENTLKMDIMLHIITNMNRQIERLEQNIQTLTEKHTEQEALI